MKLYFFDTSALAKRYVVEQGSTWVRNLTLLKNQNPIILSQITWVEVMSAFARLEREKKISKKDINLLINIFQYDWNIQYNTINLDDSIIKSSGELVQQFPLRAYDSVQLASALKILSAFSKISKSAYTFVSADKRLLDVAQIIGFIVINPNDYG